MSKMRAGFWVWMFLLLGLALYQIILIFWKSPAEIENGVWYSMAQPDTDANMLRPADIYFTLGGSDGSYGRITKQDEEFEDIFLNSYELLAYIFKNGKVETQSLDQLPWDQEACVLSYGFTLGSDLIKQQIGLGTELNSGNWSEIWVLPAQNHRENACVYILDKETGICLKIESEAWRKEQNQQLLILLRQKESTLSKDYISVGKWWSAEDLEGSFVLENTIHETAFPINANAVFVLGKKLNPFAAKDYVMRFFQYPDTVTIKESESQVLYNNEKITVTADETGYLQYVETLTEEEEETVTMREAYQLAVGFVKADLQPDQTYTVDFAFTGYEITEKQYIFDFTYVIGGIPYQMDEERRDMLRMEYPIRVTVEGNRVRRYERFVMDFTVARDQMYTLDHTWKEAMDVMADKGAIIKSIPELKYYLEDNRLVLYWRAETDTEEYLVKAGE